MTYRSWEHLIKPYKLAFEKQGDGDHLGVIVIEPLEKGFGVTLGNALRRVLLSSIRGTAVTSIKIAGTMLEFSALPGVVEDVTDIVLNVKALDLRLHGDPSNKKFTLSAVGPCVVTAGMIEGRGQLDVLDPSQVICTLGDGVNFSMDLYVSHGKGYVQASHAVFDEQKLVGEISLDACFNPVKMVSYEVEHTRVAQSTDYDRLIITIETNGSMDPRDALTEAVLILQDQLRHFVSVPLQDSLEFVKESESSVIAPSFPPSFFKNVKDLELPARCLNCLQNEGIVYVGDLVRKKDADLLKTPNFGRKSLNDISEVLGRLGLTLGMNCSGWPPENIEQHLKEI